MLHSVDGVCWCGKGVQAQLPTPCPSVVGIFVRGSVQCVGGAERSLAALFAWSPRQPESFHRNDSQETENVVCFGT